jgi:Domain of unknown function (DUF4131)
MAERAPPSTQPAAHLENCILLVQFHAMIKGTMQAAQPPTSLLERVTSQPPLMWFSLAFLGGIVLGSLISLSIWVWIALTILAILGLLLANLLAPRLNLSTFLFHPLIFIFLASLFFGAARYQLTVPHFDAFHIAFYNDRDYDLLITGTLVEPPDYRDTYTNLRLKVNDVDTGDGDLSVNGLILVRLDANQIYHYGNILRVRGKLKTPPTNEDFSYQDYLAAQNVYSYMTTAEVTILPDTAGNPIVAALYKF